jgi:dolichol-phosphate mannosyltransferase
MDGRALSPSAGRRLSLVLPAFNEEEGIRQAVAEADAALATLAEEYEIVVVDDGSADGTAAAVASEATRRPRVRLVRHATNLGYGAALRTGFEAARFDLVAFSDADCQFFPGDLGRLLPLTDEAPIVVGRREGRQDGRLRRLLSWGYNLLTRTLLGTRVRDCDCAMKVFRRDVLRQLLPESTGYLVNVEMLTRARRLQLLVKEIGVRHRPRMHGVSKIGFRDVPRTLAALLPFWWSHVLFAGGGARTLPRPTALEPAVPRGALWPGLAIVLTVAVLLFFTQLKAPLLEPQEPRYAEIPREMLAAGRFLTPTLNGDPYWDKPPLLYWLVMASYQSFGVHDWSARLVPATCGVLTAVVVFLWGRRVAGARAGLCGALVLCLSAHFVYYQRMLTMDGLLCLCVTASLAAAHTALLGRSLRLGWWLSSAAACGLGVLTKGPVALVLVLVPTVAYAFLEPRTARLPRGAWHRWAAACFGVAGPWYFAVALTEPGFAAYFFVRHNFERFLAPFDHAEPAWFFLPSIVLGLLPWSLLAPGLVRWLTLRQPRAAARRPPALGFFLLAALVGLVFFSAAGSKRPVYILPVLPPLALALGCYLDVLVPRGADLRASWRRLGQCTSSMAFVATITVVVGGAAAAGAAAVGGVMPPAIGWTLVGGAAFLGAAIVWARRRVTWPVGAAATFTVLLVGILVVLPAYNRHFSLRGCLIDLPRKSPLRVACYPRRPDSVGYYLPNAEVITFGPSQRVELLRDLRANPGTLVLLPSDKLQGLVKELPDSVEFVRHAHQGVMTAGWVRSRSEKESRVAASSADRE